MKRSRRASPQTTSVVLALAADPQAWRHGYDLCQETGLKAGTMYPILIRLAGQGLLETVWEQTRAPGRPPRHLYRLSRSGLALARDLARPASAVAEAKTTKPRLGLEGAR
jgi:DNA-binding PadR family transcriptional regulator